MPRRITKPAPVPTEMITVGDQRIRVAVREGDGD